MIIYNVKIYPMTAPPIECGFLTIKDGRIAALGDMSELKDRPDEGDLDARGLTMTPAFVDAHCHLGMFGDGLGIEGDDGNEESDPLTPQLRAIDAVNPLDRCFREAAQGGVGTVLTGMGSANAIAGSFLAMKTYGSKRVEGRVLRSPCAMKFALGENPKSVYRDRDETPVTRMATAALIRGQLAAAKRYMEDTEEYERTKGTDDESSRPDYDAKCEALIPLLKREIKAHFHCHRADDLFTALRLSEEFSLDPVLIHATEGYLVADELPKDVPCVIGPIFGDRCKPELANAAIENAAILARAGIEVSLCTDHPENPIQYLPLMAGLAIRGGMSEEDALAAITIRPARVGGVDDRVGSLSVGKDADLVLWEGSFYDVTRPPRLVLLGGEAVTAKPDGKERF
ncbi:MAG: amidohydrolase family protein [Bacteroides sp.]|nr:amidohydrolase family protein [Eubacterium sp.]MCM1418844.1 amidohydrolase family protein [Roseburia sp.]MCM1462891.1 amidohydrolase family protein [Bacteroides sp.]